MFDFTTEAYAYYLKLVKKSYKPIPFTEWNSSGIEKSILWRHDVDISLNRAVALARLEHDHGIIATYFIRLRGSGYNVLEHNQLLLAKKLIDMGHNVGLHFDHSSHQITDEESLTIALDRDKNLLQQVVDSDINVFSYHDPSNQILKFDALIYAGMINTYSRSLRESFRYISDSNGYWRHEQLRDVLSQPSKLNIQVLTHPEWWQDQPMSPFDRVSRCADGRSRNLIQSYSLALKESSRENLGASDGLPWEAQILE